MRNIDRVSQHKEVMIGINKDGNVDYSILKLRIELKQHLFLFNSITIIKFYSIPLEELSHKCSYDKAKVGEFSRCCCISRTSSKEVIKL